MKRDNPFKNDHRTRFYLTYNLIPRKNLAILDYGCGYGEFLHALSQKYEYKLIGYEPNLTVFAKLKKTKNIKFISKLRNNKLPLKSNSVDIVTLLEVIEHVPGEKVILAEINRILKPGGTLLLSTPNKGLTEIFDPGNIKFRFPRLHKFLYKNVFKLKNYEQIYEADNMVGDISRQEHMWHRHYSKAELNKLLANNFIIKKVYYYAMFLTIISMFQQAIKWVFNVNVFDKLLLADARHDYGKYSYSIFIEAIKKND